MAEKCLKIYFAGDLFDHKDLAGNMLFAAAVEKYSDHRYQIMLPQNGECEVFERTSQSIRDADFQLLFDCDLIVANFDGPDLDSGTVVEFCFAKMIDMPAILLRTDFRDSGDNTLPDGEPWNLMCSHYPRTRVLSINAMELYHQYRNSDVSVFLENYYAALAKQLINELDKVIKVPSWLKRDDLLNQFQAVLNAVGGSVADRFPEAERTQLIERKISTGLYD